MYTANSSDIATTYETNRPSTYDFLKPNGFRFVIQDLPQVAYTCQKVSLPSLDLGVAKQYTPFTDVSLTGEKVTFGDLSLTFIVSEDMANYLELFNWITSLGDPQGYDKYNNFINQRLNRMGRNSIDKPKDDAVKYSDASLVILNSSNIPKVNIKFTEIFPVQLDPVQFDTTVMSIDYLVCGVTFKYKLFEIETI
jgi:hypothetical protein